MPARLHATNLTASARSQMAEIFAHLSLRIKPFMGASVQERKMLAFKPVLEGAAITKPCKLRRRKLPKRKA